MNQLLKPVLGLAVFAAIGCSGGYSSPSGGPTAGTVLATGNQIHTTAGTPQTTANGTPFATVLSATVARVDTVSNGDGYGGSTRVTTPIPNVVVTFTIVAGASGASGTFPSAATTATATTDVNGLATAPVITANGIAGVFTVTATGTGITTPATFTLTNS